MGSSKVREHKSHQDNDGPKSDADLVCRILKQCVNKGLRIGQVFDNVACLIAEDGTDPFFVSDKKFVSCMKQYVRDFDEGAHG